VSFPVLLTATVTLWTNKWWRWWWFSKLFHWHTRQLICKHGHPQAWGTCPPWKRQKWINVLFFVQKSYQTDRKRNLTSNVAILMWNWLWTVEKKRGHNSRWNVWRKVKISISGQYLAEYREWHSDFMLSKNIPNMEISEGSIFTGVPNDLRQSINLYLAYPWQYMTTKVVSKWYEKKSKAVPNLLLKIKPTQQCFEKNVK